MRRWSLNWWAVPVSIPPDTEERNCWDESRAAARPIGSSEYWPFGYRQSESCHRRNMGNLLQPPDRGDGGGAWPMPQRPLRIARINASSPSAPPPPRAAHVPDQAPARSSTGRRLIG